MSQVLVTRHPERIGRLVLTNCDTHENFPPGIFKTMPPLAKLPGGMTLLAAPFRIGALARARLPALRPDADPSGPGRLLDGAGPADPGVKRDLKKVTIGMNKRYTLEAAEKLRGSKLPILLTWAPGDRFFPIKYAERLATETRNARIVEIPDSKTFVPLDQPSDWPRRSPHSSPAPECTRYRPSSRLFRKVQVFRPTRGRVFRQRPLQDGELMPQEIFDQDRPRSTMARRLDEAFAGCEQWTLAPPSQRRSRLDFSPRRLELLEDHRQRRHGAHPGVARAVVVGVMQEEDVAGAGGGGRATRDRSRVARRVQSLPHCDQSTGRQPRLRIGAQAGGAEDPVGRAVVGDRLAARLLDRRPRPLGVLEERRVLSRSRLRWRWQCSSTRCPAATISAASAGRRSTCSPARKKVASRRLAQDLQHRRGALRMGAVVEGQRDPVGPVLTCSDTPAPGRASERSAPAPGRGGPPLRPRPPRRARAPINGCGSIWRAGVAARAGLTPGSAWAPAASLSLPIVDAGW